MCGPRRLASCRTLRVLGRITRWLGGWVVSGWMESSPPRSTCSRTPAPGGPVDTFVTRNNDTSEDDVGHGPKQRPRRGTKYMKSRLAVGLLLGCLMTAAGCSSNGSSTASPATTAASPATTTASPTPKITAKNFQVSTPDGQVSLSLDGQLPPKWPSQFPVPAGAKAAGSGSLGGSSSATLVAAYTTSESASDAFAFYKDNSKLTTSDQKSVGAGSHYLGKAKITAPYTGSVTVVSHSGTTYIVIVLTNAPSSSSPSASAS